jgi:ribonuclease P protein component
MARVWRLRPGGEFERVRQNGRSWPHRCFILIVLPRADQLAAPPRLGLAAGKRLGNAVLRNRIKRRLREAVRKIYPNLSTGIDVIIIARAPIINMPLIELTAALAEAFRRAKVWSPEETGEQSPTLGGMDA